MRDPSIDIIHGENEEGEALVIEISVSYSKGGMNYMNYKTDPRGYYLHVRPVTISDHFRTYSITPGSTKGGFKQCFEQCKRLNRKRLEQLQDLIDGIDRDKVLAMWLAGDNLGIYYHIMRVAQIEVAA